MTNVIVRGVDWSIIVPSGAASLVVPHISKTLSCDVTCAAASVTCDWY